MVFKSSERSSEKQSGDLPSLPGQGAQYPELVTGGVQNIFYAHHAFPFFKGALIFFHLGHLSEKFQDCDLAHFF